MTMFDDQRAVYEALLVAQSAGEAVAMVTVIQTSGSIPRHAGSKMLVRSDGSTVGTVGGGALEGRVIQEALAAIADGQPRLRDYHLNSLDDGDPGICGGTIQMFIEPTGVMPTLLVIGAGHCGQALAELGKWSGYRVSLCDDRAEYCNPETVPGLDAYIICSPSEITQRVTITAQTYIAATTRGLPVDLDLIPQLLETPAPYIGVIGSRRRWLLASQALRERGLTDAQLGRVRSPIGLEIEAETPKEIAVSIMAEIIMIRRGGTGKPMAVQTAGAQGSPR